MRIKEGLIERHYYTKYFPINTPRDVILDELKRVVDETKDIVERDYTDLSIHKDNNVLYGTTSVLVQSS